MNMIIDNIKESLESVARPHYLINSAKINVRGNTVKFDGTALFPDSDVTISDRAEIDEKFGLKQHVNATHFQHSVWNAASLMGKEIGCDYFRLSEISKSPFSKVLSPNIPISLSISFTAKEVSEEQRKILIESLVATDKQEDWEGKFVLCDGKAIFTLDDKEVAQINCKFIGGTCN